MFVKRREHKELFDQAFHVFWKKPKMLEQLMQLLFQQITRPASRQGQAGRLPPPGGSDVRPGRDQSRREEKPGAIEFDATFSHSAMEVLRAKDFEQMTVAEQAQARQAIARLRLASSRDPDAPLSAVSRMASASICAARSRLAPRRRPHHRSRTSASARWREPPLVVLCDISGSCSNYSRMFLHFLHALIE